MEYIEKPKWASIARKEGEVIDVINCINTAIRPVLNLTELCGKAYGFLKSKKKNPPHGLGSH